MKSKLFLFGCYVLALSTSNKSDAQVCIPGTRQAVVASGVNGHRYRLDILLPEHYQGDSNKTYPVVYLLDSQWDFPLFDGIYGSQHYDGFLPDLVVVGITWEGAITDYSGLRVRDFTPTAVAGQDSSGGAGAFLEVIKNDIFPYVDAHYRVNSHRTLVGTSLGGLFGLYALFQAPALFQNYVIASPSLWWDHGVIKQYERQYEKKKGSSKAKVFLAIGSLETDVPDFTKFADHLKSGNPSRLETESLVIGNTGHSGVAAEGFARGMQAVFRKPDLLLSPAVLRPLTGTYRLGDIKIDLSIKQGMLFAVTPEAKYPLYAAGPQDFYVKGANISLHFKTGTAGKVSGFDLTQYQGVVFVKKVNE